MSTLVQDEIPQEIASWTQAKWRLITTQLIPIIDEELGPAKSDSRRVLRKNAWDRVRKRWLKRS
jgi:hypothetical protein